MKNSTIVGISLLAVAGVGAYVYLKRKKSTTTTTTTTSSSAVDSSLGLPAVTTTSVVDTVTGATKTTKTDTTSGTAVTTVTNVIDETKTNNYIMAKKISEEIAGLQDEIKNLELEYTKWSKDFKFSGVGFETQVRNQKRYETVEKPSFFINIKMQEKSKQANALGYKILPYGLIEKM